MRSFSNTRGICVVLLAVGLAFPACGGGGGGGDGDGGGLPDDGGPASTTTYLWCAANKDAHVTSQMPDFANGGAFSLVCAHGLPNGEQRTYVQFFMPQLPAGCVVLEAYINLHEDSDTGQTGSAAIPVGTANTDWNPAALTWNNQPNPAGPLSVGATIAPFVGVNQWRGTANINLLVQGHLDSPATNFGFVLDSTAAGAYTRSFRAMNAPQARTQTVLGTGPRLLMKIQSPIPLDAGNIGTTVPANSELGVMYGFGTDIRVYNRATGGWPASWDVHIQ